MPQRLKRCCMISKRAAIAAPFIPVCCIRGQDMGTGVAGGLKMSQALARQLGPQVGAEQPAAWG